MIWSCSTAKSSSGALDAYQNLRSIYPATASLAFSWATGSLFPCGLLCSLSAYYFCQFREVSIAPSKALRLLRGRAVVARSGENCCSRIFCISTAPRPTLGLPHSRYSHSLKKVESKRLARFSFLTHQDLACSWSACPQNSSRVVWPSSRTASASA